MSSAESRDHRGDHERRDGGEGPIPDGPKGGRRIGALIVGLVLGIFVVLLVIWLLGRSADDVDGAAVTGTVSWAGDVCRAGAALCAGTG